MRRTKIISTIGPASESVSVLQELFRAGVNVARLNFSHGSHEEHGARIKAIREAATVTKSTVAIMLDTKGPEIRTGLLKDGKAVLREGAELILTVEDVLGDESRIAVSYKDLPKEVAPGDTILIDDGLISLEVKSVKGSEVSCAVLNGGEISNRKGVNLPGKEVNLPSITDKDIADIHFGIRQRVDFIAASFIRTASDVLAIRRILEEQGADIHIIAKIESQAGVNNIDEIIRVSDGIMVARGDLGVEIPAEEVPLVQKTIIEKCNRAGKIVITATQMLDSMIRNPRPTRAEASDIANAILDGTDAIMLSGETASGKYPIESVKTMARIAIRTEQALEYADLLRNRLTTPQKTITDAISHAAVTIASDLRAAAIITPTASGSTARTVSKYRPLAPIVAASPREDVLRKLCAVWGVQPVLVNRLTGTDEMINAAVSAALDKGYINSGELVVITAGVPAGVPGTTNLIKVHIVGEILARGMGIGQRSAVGVIRIARTAVEASTKVRPGDILVTSSTDRDFVPAMEKAAAVITEVGGLTSHAAIVGLNMGIPVVVGVDGATSRLEDGITVTVDGCRGLIYKGETKVM
ncbi:MAG: pyruvate kinase [Bacillota bacterium]